MLEIFEGIEDEGQEETKLPEDFEIDFDALKLTGRKVSGAKALEVWCFFALSIERYRYRAFSWQYGIETEDLIGTSYGRDFSESEIKRRITDALCVHPNISDVSDFEISFDGGTLSVSCTVETDFGEIQISPSLMEELYV